MNELRTEKKVNLEILSDKRVEVLLITVYFLGDKELTRENFRFCLKVGDIETASLYLDEEYINLLNVLWS